MLDEFRTSARCPGCGSVVEDAIGCHRIRQCTSLQGMPSNERANDAGCVLHNECGAFKIDRDELATINMMQCAYGALRYAKRGVARRPEFLCRSPEEHAFLTVT